MSSQSYGFSSSHEWTWELDHEDSWVSKNRCFWMVVLEKTLESPFDCKEFKPINAKGNQSWKFPGMTDAEAEVPILRLPHGKSWLINKDREAGKDWRPEEKGMTEDEMVGWHPSLTHWTWFWTSSRRWWRVRKPDVLQSMGSQRVKHDWGTEKEHIYVTSFCLDLNTEMILRNTVSFFRSLHNAGSKSCKGFKVSL